MAEGRSGFYWEVFDVLVQGMAFDSSSSSSSSLPNSPLQRMRI